MEKNMFQLLDDLKKASKATDEHYFSCESCDRYYKNIDVPKCQTYLDLCDAENKIKNEIKEYKIDIE